MSLLYNTAKVKFGSFRGSSDKQHEVSGGWWLAEYSRDHKIGLRHLAGGREEKMLIYSCQRSCGGLGDRLSGIISAFYMAVAAKRIFCIDSTVPVPLNLTLVPAALDWNCAHLAPLTSNAQTLNVMDHIEPLVAFSRIFKAHDDGITVLRLELNLFSVSMALWTPSIVGQPSDHVYRFIGHMCRLDQLNKRFRPLATREIFQLAFNALFLFSDTVRSRAESMWRDMGMVSSIGSVQKYIGIHARLGGVNNSPKAVAWVDPVRHSLHDAPAFLSCARSKSLQGYEHILVFSDRAEFKSLCKSIDGNIRYVNSTTIFHIDRSSKAHALVEAGTIDTFAEFYLLSKAACIVGSRSTFTGCAAAIARQGENCHSFYDSCNSSPLDFFEEFGRREMKFA